MTKRDIIKDAALVIIFATVVFVAALVILLNFTITNKVDVLKPSVFLLGLLLILGSVGFLISLYFFLKKIGENMNKEDQVSIANNKNLMNSEKMESIVLLSSGVSHEFNNQLSAILGYIDLIDGCEDTEKRIEYSFKIRQIIKHSANLTGQLMAYSRKSIHKKVPIDINIVIKELADVLARTSNVNIAINTKLPSSPIFVEGDSTMIQNAFFNLAVNARDAMKNGGELGLVVEKFSVSDELEEGDLDSILQGDYILVKVTDTGVGMNYDTQKKIFDPFFTTKELGIGSGMGLAAVYGTVKSHGGFIKVDTTPGEGTIFSVFLPIFNKEDHVEKPIVNNIENAVNSAHILLVDDEKMICQIGKKLLEKSGYKVTTCLNGAEAISIFKKYYKEIDLVLLDIIMPVLGGKETFEQIKEIDPTAKVILASGYTSEVDAKEMLQNGVIDFLEKPYGSIELTEKIEKALSLG